MLVQFSLFNFKTRAKNQRRQSRWFLCLLLQAFSIAAVLQCWKTDSEWFGQPFCFLEFQRFATVLDAQWRGWSLDSLHYHCLSSSFGFASSSKPLFWEDDDFLAYSESVPSSEAQIREDPSPSRFRCGGRPKFSSLASLRAFLSFSAERAFYTWRSGLLIRRRRARFRREYVSLVSCHQSTIWESLRCCPLVCWGDQFLSSQSKSLQPPNQGFLSWQIGFCPARSWTYWLFPILELSLADRVSLDEVLSSKSQYRIPDTACY